MAPHGDKSRFSRWAGVVLVSAILAIGFFLLERSNRAESRVSESHATVPIDVPPIEPMRTTKESATEDSVRDISESSDSFLIDRDFDIAVRWSRVDLDDVKAAMPDNLFRELGMPTSDPAVLDERAAVRAGWNEEFGKVLSGTATSEEIQSYYAQRYRLSADYVEFGSHLIEHYGGILPARDVGLLELRL